MNRSNFQLNPIVAAALVVGVAAFVAQCMYLRGIPPLRADAGIQVSGALIGLWFILLIIAFRDGRRPWWVLLATLPALLGPMLFIGLIASCAFAQRCP
jgi:hypothetical protein